MSFHFARRSHTPKLTPTPNFELCFGVGSRRRSAPQVSDLIDTEGVTRARLFTSSRHFALAIFAAVSVERVSQPGAAHHRRRAAWLPPDHPRRRPRRSLSPLGGSSRRAHRPRRGKGGRRHT